MSRKITVYNKQGERIAVFSDKNYNVNGRAKRDLMVSPTIDIVQNGESTLSFEMLHSSTKWQDIKNPENIYECNNRYYTALNTNSIVYDGDIVRVTLVERWYLLSKVFVQAYNTDTRIEAFDDHTVKILPKSTASLVVNGTKYADSEVKDATGKIMPRGSAGYALWAILRGTDWKLGICDVLPEKFSAKDDYGTFNVETDMKSALENIQFIQSLYGGILDWDSKNKVLNLRDETKKSEFNEWKGYAVRKEKNLQAPPIITWDNDIITKLYPLGNGNLNIKKVNNDKGYVTNFSYTDSVYEGYIQNANIYDTNDEGGQKTLKFWAEEKLKKLCKPRKSIQYEIVDLRATDEFVFETCDINEVIKAYYTDTETGEEVSEFLRITHLNYNYFYPSSESVIEVGDKVANETELFYQIYKNDKNSAPTDNNGNLSGWDIMIEIPESFWAGLGGWGYSSLNDLIELYAEKITDNTKATAGLKIYADETFSTIESFTTFQKETEEQFSLSQTSINQLSDELQAQITLEASHYNELTTSIRESNASINLVADDLKAQIELESSHYKETQNKFVQSNTDIKSVSDELKALITLETNHYQENSKLISESSTKIQSLSNDLRAQITLEAKHYEENKKATNGVSSALARYKAEANGTFATTSQLASYSTKDETGKAIADSEASIKSYASQNFAGVSIVSKVNDIDNKTKGLQEGYAIINSSNVKLGYSGAGQLFIQNNGVAVLVARALTLEGSSMLNIQAPTLYIMGKKAKWQGKYLVNG